MYNVRSSVSWYGYKYPGTLRIGQLQPITVYWAVSVCTVMVLGVIMAHCALVSCNQSQSIGLFRCALLWCWVSSWHIAHWSAATNHSLLGCFGVHCYGVGCHHGTLRIGQLQPITVYWAVSVCTVMVLGVIMCSFYSFPDRVLFHHDGYDYNWDFMSYHLFWTTHLHFSKIGISSFATTHLSGCFCPWTFSMNIGLNMSNLRFPLCPVYIRYKDSLQGFIGFSVDCPCGIRCRV